MGHKAKECRWQIVEASRKTPKPDISVVKDEKTNEPVARINNPTPGKTDQNTGNDYSVWLWASEPKAKEAEDDGSRVDATSVKDQDVDPALPVDDEVNQILVTNPGVNASTFYNLLKSKGMKITREAIQSTANTPVLRDGLADKGSKKKKKLPGIYIPTKGKKATEAREAGVVMKVAANHVKSMKESTNNKTSNIYTTLQCRFTETAKDLANPTSAIKFKSRLIGEGMGNLKDGYYYTKEALKSAVPVFEGKKMYADHPSKLDEEIRPERSVRDIIGHFENVTYGEDKDGCGYLEAELCMLPDESFQWARALLRHAVDFSTKFPDKDFIGLSINASGDALPMDIKEFLKQGDLPKSTLPKIESAMAEGLSEIKIVKAIADAVSCDLVTEAGARGKVLQMLEAEMQKDKKDEMEKKENDDAAAKKDDAEDKKEGDEKVEDDASKKDGEKSDDEGHDDEGQDKELIKKMLKKHLGDEAMEDEAAHKAAKHYMAAYESMGHDKEAAADKACEAMKMSSMAKEAMEAEESDDEKKEDDKAMEKKESDDKKVEREVIRLKGENAKLQERLDKIEVANHLETKLKESKLPMAVTKKFKETCKNLKSKKEVDEKFELFLEGYRSTSSGDASVGYADAFVVSTEKTVQSGEAPKGYSDCI